MAARPLYIPTLQAPYVTVQSIEFDWYPGFSVSQKQKSIQSLHKSAMDLRYCRTPLEISSKSTDMKGVAMSAFNLMIKRKSGKKTSVENLFQAAKVFEKGGPFTDLLQALPKDAKRDPRLKEHGDLIHFRGKDGNWPLEPKTLFYDWVYLNALNRNPELAEHLLKFDAFTDIEFNPTKSFNCQAHSAAIFVGLKNSGNLTDALSSSKAFRDFFTTKEKKSNRAPVQKSLV